MWVALVRVIYPLGDLVPPYPLTPFQVAFFLPTLFIAEVPTITQYFEILYDAVWIYRQRASGNGHRFGEWFFMMLCGF